MDTIRDTSLRGVREHYLNKGDKMANNLTKTKAKKLAKEIADKFDPEDLTNNGHARYVREELDELDGIIVKYKPEKNKIAFEYPKYSAIDLNKMDREHLQKILDNWDNLETMKEALEEQVD